jgi:hypothetical protein
MSGRIENTFQIIKTLILDEIQKSKLGWEARWARVGGQKF